MVDRSGASAARPAAAAMPAHILTPKQQIEHQISNERYLRQHPEVHTIIRCLTRQIMKHQPDHIEPFLCEFVASEAFDTALARLQTRGAATASPP
ncbi:hypothetical protein CXG81DRAFT_26505 [Caulochytrium protostelioides]|uniref:RIIa domain-containing protein n=1 Tax=Caulochytrium protostelioides TaxID=1555241 RepID=A0A4P9X6J4_9FUNG|nr:hypothetical protein CXG81DRAFT_26505 [Caulochytrium protostelioides]|eukprot:RKP00804.1 hypothetical protein CXG81DRAFT_26505 [Caulochytrium protostelioides]